MASPDLSLDDLNGGFLGVKHLILHVDYAMALNVEYDGQPGDPQVSLISGPARCESQMIDECLAEHRDELSIRLLRCPQCASSGGADATQSARTAVRLWKPSATRARSGFGSRHGNGSDGMCPGFRHGASCPSGLSRTRYEGVAQPPELCVPLSLVFRLLLEDMQGTRRRHIRECWDHLCLGKSVGDVLPRGDTIEEKHRHYLIVRDKLTDGYNWMLGSVRQYPEFRGRVGRVSRVSTVSSGGHIAQGPRIADAGGRDGEHWARGRGIGEQYRDRKETQAEHGAGRRPCEVDCRPNEASHVCRW